jgi:2-polyprenyl-3-methyl-5-hydroxy-6-metoxy-1,4-benzoquinol methylase
MTVRVDPEANGSRALFGMADLDGLHVLEIGCGDGRFTWSFADTAGHVTAIDPDAEQIALAREHLPAKLQGRVEFHDIGFEDFAAASPPAAFDVVILSWALC